MKIKRISLYKEFQCTGAECRVNCCKGWRVPLDVAAYEKYEAEKGNLGLLFRIAVKWERGVPMIRSIFGKCPFWGKDHLCRIQKKYGVECMAQICREFPRRLSNLGFFCEETLYLACPEAARLFLTHVRQGKRLAFEEEEGEPAYRVNTTNDDEGFLSYLLTAREQMIRMLGSGWDFDSTAILRYGKDAQEACLSGKSCPDPAAYKELGGSRLQLDSAVLNALFFNGFYHPYLKIQSPFLHQLCARYIRKIGIPGGINRKAADRKLAEIKDCLCRKIPDAELIFNRYYEYYLQSEFLDIFEDYGFLKCLVYGMAKAEMLWVLIGLYAQDKNSVTEDEIARIIAVYERRAPQVKETLFPILADAINETDITV